MLPCLRRPSARLRNVPNLRRSLSSTPSHSYPRAATSKAGDAEGKDKEEADDLDYETKLALFRRAKAGDPTPDPWLEGDGQRYRDPKRGPNWIGDNFVSVSSLCCNIVALIVLISPFQ